VARVKKRLALGAALAVATCAARAGADDAAPPATLGTLAAGAWTLTPVVETRVRGEYRRDVDAADTGLLVERTRLGVDAASDALEARVVFQDARALSLTPEAAAMTGPTPMAVTGAYEAWCEAHTPGVQPSYLRVGRQPVSWGEGRLLGTSDWSPAGRSLDALRGRLVVGDGAAEVLAAALTDPATGATIDAYGELFGARFGWSFDPLFKLETYALARIAQANPVASVDGSVLGQTYTASVRLYGDSFAWTWGFEAAGQLGWEGQFGEDRAAWAAAAHVAHLFDRGVFTPSVRLGGAYASGPGGGSTYHTFDPLLPDVHTWHGAMDVFAWSNEAEVNARVKATPSTQTAFELEYRYARLAQAAGPWVTAYLTTIDTASAPRSGELGHEIDAAFAWSPWPPMDLRIGYSLLVLGTGARAILQAQSQAAPTGPFTVPDAAHFAYAQAGLAL
jgi:hypothetical protein